jgi:two-component system response regulator HupR/HoxA
MINWDEFEHIHVIRKLKQILASWWNVDTIFTDERGYLKGFDKAKMTYANPGVAMLMQKDAALDNLAEVVSKTLEDLRLSENRYSLRRWDLAGFDIGIFPIWIDNDLVGAVIGLGFLKDNSPQRAAEIREHMAAFRRFERSDRTDASENTHSRRRRPVESLFRWSN